MFSQKNLCFLPLFLKQARIPPLLQLTRSDSLFAAPPSAPQTGVGRDGEGERGWRQDRTGAFSLEIITFTLLMYGQTTKDTDWQ